MFKFINLYHLFIKSMVAKGKRFTIPYYIRAIMENRNIIRLIGVFTSNNFHRSSGWIWLFDLQKILRNCQEYSSWEKIYAGR